MKLHLLLLCVVCFTLECVCSSCDAEKNYDAKLVQLDSLLSQRHHQEVYDLLKQIDESSIPEHDRHYYELLLTQAQYMCYIPFKSDSLINATVEYFSKSGDNHNYIRSLIYQGGVREDMGNLELAVDSYHSAENAAEGVDTVNLAYAKFRMGFLYKSQIVGAQTIALQKLKESLPLLRKIGDKYYEQNALLEIGGIYRGIEGKGDSAVIYLTKAIELAQWNKEEQQLFNSRFALAEYYDDYAHDYNRAKTLINEALSDKNNITHPRAHCRAASIYMHLGNVDSAQYFIKTMPKIVNRIDSVIYLKTLSEYFKYKKDLPKAETYKLKSRYLSDSILINNLNSKLLTIEKKYDKQEEELKNERLQSSLNHTLLILAIVTLFVVLLGSALLSYRRRLIEKQHEYLSLTSELNNSLAQMQEMQSLMRQLSQVNSKSAELFKTIDSQISVIHELVLLSHELPESKFIKKFQQMLTVSRDDSTEGSVYWENLQMITNELYNGIIEKAIKQSSVSLRKDEINLLCLFCCGYSNTGIMVCMHYTNIRTIYNKKRQIADKLGVKTLEEFLMQHKKLGLQ
ncbi:MAG: hypothetical protein MJZ74_01030 [Muribaculaceae bacterium]|nr:hypothetical protein [Muribaculaceae bacterium]